MGLILSKNPSIQTKHVEKKRKDRNFLIIYRGIIYFLQDYFNNWYHFFSAREFY